MFAITKRVGSAAVFFFQTQSCGCENHLLATTKEFCSGFGNKGSLLSENGFITARPPFFWLSCDAVHLLLSFCSKGLKSPSKINKTNMMNRKITELKSQRRTLRLYKM